MELASRLGVWAGARFPFPRRFLVDILGRVLGPAEDRLTPEIMSFSLMARLPELLPLPELAPVRHYIETAGPDALAEVSEQIGRVFDRYLVYRPDVLQAWQQEEAGDLSPEQRWQPIVWRSLVTHLGAEPLGARILELERALGAEDRTFDLPPRVSLFGLSTLPPMYVHVLELIARHVDVHMFLHTPSPHYFGDARPRSAALREAMRRPSADGGGGLGETDGPLGDWGHVLREFQLIWSGTAHRDGPAPMVEPKSDTLLHALQGLVFHRRAPSPGSTLAPDDDSVMVHSCHGPLREIEVLHDQLLAVFEDGSIGPRDVIVMTPDIDAYAPYIHAVFQGQTMRTRIPFTVADRGVASGHEVMTALGRVLAVAQGRVTAPEVMDLLGVDCIRQRFELTQEDVETARPWIIEAGIRWGLDAEHRASHGQLSVDANTWRQGLDRMFLGMAMPEGASFGDASPLPVASGSEAPLVGRLAAFLETLERVASLLSVDRTPADWAHALRLVMDLAVVDSEDTARQRHELIDALFRLVDTAAAAGFAGTLSLAVLWRRLEASLGQTASSEGFLSGAVTFSELVPMRSVPFQVVCLIGMNDGAFPRSDRPPSFDLMAPRENRRVGDPSRREDDRTLFLEALLSARQRLVVSYVGQDIQTDAQQPPSVLVSELLDLVEQGHGAQARSRIVVTHPLAAFSERYFDGSDPRLFSYVPLHRDAAEVSLGTDRVAPKFLSEPLPPPETGPIALADLERFIQNPSQAFLGRLGIRLWRDLSTLEAREPLSPGNLEKHALRKRALELRFAGHDHAQVRRELMMTGQLPLAAMGAALYDALVPELDSIVTQVTELRGGEPERRIDVELGRIVGTLAGVHGNRGVYWRPGSVGPKYRFLAWLRHLVLTEVMGPSSTHFIGTKDSMALGRVTGAAAHLEAIVDLYREGLTRPLPLFPASSQAYADPKRCEPLAAAVSAFDKTFSDGSDDYVRLAFQSARPLDDPEFVALARRVAVPLVEAEKAGV